MAKISTGASSSILSKVVAICDATVADYHVEGSIVNIFSVGITEKESDLLTKKIRKALGSEVSIKETYNPDLASEDKEDGYVLDAFVSLS